MVLAVVDNNDGAVVSSETNSSTNSNAITIDQDISGRTLTDSVELSGNISVANAKLLLIRNGNIDRATHFSADATGRWQTKLLINDLGHYDNSFTVYAPQLNLLSETQHFSASNISSLSGKS